MVLKYFIQSWTHVDQFDALCLNFVYNQFDSALLKTLLITTYYYLFTLLFSKTTPTWLKWENEKIKKNHWMQGKKSSMLIFYYIIILSLVHQLTTTFGHFQWTKALNHVKSIQIESCNIFTLYFVYNEYLCICILYADCI